MHDERSHVSWRKEALYYLATVSLQFPETGLSKQLHDANIFPPTLSQLSNADIVFLYLQSKN